jgi:fatty acid desaturase
MANGPLCGQATSGQYCWFHQNMMGSQAQPQAAGQTHTVGTSHAWATTNTTPELAVETAKAMHPTKAPWYSGMKWWKVLIAVVVVAVIIWKFWAWIILIALGLLLFGFLRMMMGMNVNSNRNANENVNQNTVSPTFNVSPIVNVQVFGEDR